MLRAELYRPGAPDDVVAVATWSSSGGANLEELDPSAGLAGLLRQTPVVVDDPSLRRLGTRGESMLQPGSLEWFRAALRSRAAPLGLALRFVVDEVRNGWDPAANYRTFEEQAGRLASS